MAIPRFFRYSNKACWAPRVIAVDDAWFEGTNLGGPIFRKLKLGGVHKKEQSLSLLLRHIEAGIDQMYGDGLYLKAIVEQCIVNGFELWLSNFEGMQANWNNFNSKGTAILVDMNYTSFAVESMREGFGLNLIKAELAGKRPAADIFIVTGLPESAHKILEKNRHDPNWWPVRGLPVVSKNSDEVLLDELTCFANYFKQGNIEKPFIELLRTLIRANLEGWSHPNDFSEIPSDLPFRDKYQNDLNSIKSLYHNSQTGSESADYPIQAGVLVALLGSSGFPIELGFDLSNNTLIWLPYAPFGVFWILQIWDFLYRLTEKMMAGQTGVLRLSSNGFATLEIPLHPEIQNMFLEAWLKNSRRKGLTTRALERLNNFELRLEMFDGLKSEERHYAFSLLETVTFKDICNYSINTPDCANIVIQWRGEFL